MSEAKVYPFRILANRRWWFTLSIVVILAGFAKMGFNHSQTGSALNYGIDFTGGAAYIFQFKPPLQGSSAEITGKVRSALAGVETKGETAKKAKIQVFSDGEVQVITATGSDRSEATSAAMADKDAENAAILAGFRKAQLGEVQTIASDLIGPVVGDYLKATAFWSLLIGCALITLYIWGRYNIKGIGSGWMFGLAAVIALLHDASVMVAVYAWTNTEVNTSFVAAVLTIIGYSVNDTVIIFDRLRENLLRQETAQRRNLDALGDTLDMSVWQTMSRSILTAVSTLLPMITLFLFGGVTLRDFAFALIIGIIAGGYSSIFLAPPLFTFLYARKQAKESATGQGAQAGPARPRRRETAPSSSQPSTGSRKAVEPSASARPTVAMPAASSSGAKEATGAPAPQPGEPKGKGKGSKSGGSGPKKRKRRY